MKTVLQEVIQWTLENAFNVEAQDGTNYIAIDHEEMRTKFDEWLEKERDQIAEAFNDVSLDGDKLGHVYFDQTFTEVVS
jgi:hypothetical protein